MRITNNMMISNMLVNLQRNMSEVSKSQEMMASGKKFILPSDDPIGMAKSLRLNSDIAATQQYRKNCDAATSWMDMTEASIDQIQKVLTRASELAVQAANEPYTENETDKIGEELKQLKQELIGQANSTYAGRYLYSGFKTDSKLVDDNGKYNVSVGKTAAKEFNPSVVTDVPPTGGNLEIEIANDGVTKKVVSIPYGVAAASVNIVTTNLKTGASTSAAATPPTANTSTWNNFAAAINGNTDLQAAGVTASIVTEVTGKAQLVINANSNVMTDTGASKPLGLTAQPENIEYLVGVADTVKVNVLGTDLFGVGVKGEVPQMIKVFDDFITSLTLKAAPLDDSIAKCQTPADATNFVNTITNLKDSAGNNIIDAATISKVTTILTAPIDNDKRSQVKTIVDDAISKYRRDGFQSAIANLSACGDVASKVRAQVGSIGDRTQLTSNRLDDEKVNFTKLLSSNEEVDVEEIYTQLTSQQAVFQASLSIGAKIIQPSLVEFIK